MAWKNITILYRKSGRIHELPDVYRNEGYERSTDKCENNIDGCATCTHTIICIILCTHLQYLGRVERVWIIWVCVWVGGGGSQIVFAELKGVSHHTPDTSIYTLRTSGFLVVPSSVLTFVDWNNSIILLYCPGAFLFLAGLLVSFLPSYRSYQCSLISSTQ